MESTEKNVLFSPYDDYAQSANTLFHFVTKREYLESILLRRAIIPRYCVETVDYLNINSGGREFKEVAILQKCFCDIQIHKLAETFSVKGVGESFDSLDENEKHAVENNNTHFAYYGEFAIAFSKRWGEQNNLQPVHYINRDSQFAKDFISLFAQILNKEDVPEDYSQDIINRLAYIKPLRGIMRRTITRKDSQRVVVELYKNFHDECEWRYIPNTSALEGLKLESIIANPNIIDKCDLINNSLENESYRELWLTFSYDDIRYIIVPDAQARIELIKTIMDLSDDCFENKEEINLQKNVLISKILVLEEIGKDW